MNDRPAKPNARRPAVADASALALDVAAWALLLLLASNMEAFAPLLRPLFPQVETLVYDRTSFIDLLIEHAWLVLASSGLAAVVGVALGVFVTRPFGRDLLPVADSLAALGQTAPPVAVLAVAVPLTGFGAAPTIIALFLYGLLPIFRNTSAGVEAVPRAVREAATGMGMTDLQTLWRVELRLAWPVIMAGVRSSVVVNIGTATIGATIGAGGLGGPIIAGVASQNPAWVLEGAVMAGLFAVLVDRALGKLETAMTNRRQGRAIR